MSKLREKLRSAKDNLQSKVGSDVRTAERTGSKKVRTVKQRVSAVDRDDAKRALRRAGEHVEGAGESVMTGQSLDADGSFAAAEDASTMAPPVNASLRPTTSPEDVDAWVTGGSTPQPENATKTAKDVKTAAETGALGFQIDEFATGSTGNDDYDLIGLGSTPSHENAQKTAQDVKTTARESDAFNFEFDVGVGMADGGSDQDSFDFGFGLEDGSNDEQRWF